MSLEHLSETQDNPRAKVLASTLDQATGRLLQENKSPTRRLGGIDNRGSQYYLASFWAEALAQQNEDAELKTQFSPISVQLSTAEDAVVAELNGVQGSAVDVGGYFQPDEAKATAAMRPSSTFNAIIDAI